MVSKIIIGEDWLCIYILEIHFIGEASTVSPWLKLEGQPDGKYENKATTGYLYKTTSVGTVMTKESSEYTISLLNRLISSDDGKSSRATIGPAFELRGFH